MTIGLHTNSKHLKSSIVRLINSHQEKISIFSLISYVLNEKKEQDINCCAQNSIIISIKHLSFFFRSNKIYPERLFFSASNATH